MRLFHKDLLSVLPTMQLKGQWRECCLIAKALHDGNLNHILVNRVKDYPIEHFYRYCGRVVSFMVDKGFKCDYNKLLQYADDYKGEVAFWHSSAVPLDELFDGWHNDRYLRQCLYNLEEKAICGGIPADEWQKIYDVYGKRFDLWNGKEGE